MTYRPLVSLIAMVGALFAISNLAQAQSVLATGGEVALGTDLVKHHPFLAVMGAATIGGVLLRQASLARRGTDFDPANNDGTGTIMAKSASAELTDNMEGALDENQERVDQDKEPGCEAHHIVMAGASANINIIGAQNILAACSIGINSFHNGVYLPRFKKNQSSPKLPLLCRHATDHSTLHTNAYKLEVYNRLNFAYVQDQNSNNPGHCGEVMKELRNMKIELEMGGLK